MRSIWAVTRQTFAQCLRMKVAGVFIVALALAVAVMPFAISGETLAGRVQTFLSYSVSLTAGLLSVVTIFLAVAVVSSDVRDRQIFTVAVKPLPRWQYIVGRWAGVVLLDFVLLAAAAIGIYVAAQHLRDGEPLNAEDRRKVETEVFTARRRIGPEPIAEEVRQAVDRRIQTAREEGRLGEILQSFIDEAGGDREAGEQALLQELYKQELEKRQSAGPGESLEFAFTDIGVAGETVSGSAEVIETRRPLIHVEAPTTLVANLVYRGPVTINGVDGRVIWLGEEAFQVWFPESGWSQAAVRDLSPGAEAEVVIEPTIQLTYKLDPAVMPSDRSLRGQWYTTRPPMFSRARTDPVQGTATLTLPADLVADGRLEIAWRNLTHFDGAPTSVTIQRQDLAVLYRVGSFSGNFLRGMLLIGVQLMFLAGLGVLAGSFLSFAVGCLVCFVFLPFSLARAFLSEAVELPSHPDAMTPFIYIGHYVFRGMAFLLPDFADTNPADALVDGMNLTWGFVAETSAVNILVRTGVVLVLGCIIFHKRELAAVQV